jgi:hypothetical protein
MRIPYYIQLYGPKYHQTSVVAGAFSKQLAGMSMQEAQGWFSAASLLAFLTPAEGERRANRVAR